MYQISTSAFKCHKRWRFKNILLIFKCRQAGQGPKEDCEEYQSAGEPALRGKSEGVRFLLSGGNKAQGGPYHSIPVLKGWLKRGQKLSLHKEPHGEYKMQSVHAAMGEISTQYKKETFYSKINYSLEQPPWECSRVLFAGDS